eukprot:Stramenopile-MAST_4_protein_780
MSGNNDQPGTPKEAVPSSPLQRIIKLFTDRHTCELFERHVQAVESVARKYKDGLYVSDLVHIQRILTLACDSLLLGHNEFVQPVCAVLAVCGKPFLESKSNEMFLAIDTICDTIVVIASLMISCPARICMAAANTLQCMFEMKDFRDAADTPAAVGIPTGGSPDDMRPNLWFFHQQVVDRSGVIKIIVAALRKLISEVESERVEFEPEVSVEPDETVWDAADRLKPSADTRKRMLHFEVLRCVIRLVRELSFSKANAKTLVKEGVPLICVSALSVCDDFKEPLVPDCIDIAWNLLETSSNELMNTSISAVSRTRSKLIEKWRTTNCLRVMGVKKTFDVLRGLLEQTLVSGFRGKDKELRNNLLVVCSILARHRNNHQFFVSSGLLDLLLLYSSAMEIGLPTPSEPHNYATSSECDFELKRLMWQLISDIAMHQEDEPVDHVMETAHTAISQMPLVETLLLYMDINRSQEESLRVWSPPQLRVLRIDACGLLGVLLHVPECQKKFVDHDGPRVVLSFLQNAIPGFNNAAAEGNASPSIGRSQSTMTTGAMDNGASLNRSVVHDTEMELAAVRLLSHCSSQPESNIVNSLAENGAVRTMLNLFQADLGDDVGAFELRTQTINALGNLCDPRGGKLEDGSVDPERTAVCVQNQDELRRAGGVVVLRERLHYDPLMPASAEVLLMMVVDTIWRAVVGNRKSEVRLIDNDGVDSLLDLIEIAPVAMHRQILGCLADLCQNRRAQSYYRAWRSSSSMRGASTILLKLWSAEELRLRIRNDEKGMVSNLEAPLKGDLRPIVCTKPPTPAPESQQENAADEDIDIEDDSNAPGKIDRTGEPTLEEEIGSLTGEAKRSKLYKRLRRALETAKDITLFSETNDPGADFRIASESKDLRVLVWSVFESVGWENLGLENDDTCDDVVMIALKCCRNYREFKLGESWDMVRTELRDLRVNPIKPDALLMEMALENAYNSAMETKYEQNKLVQAIKDRDAEKERGFFDNILKQQEQEVQQHLIASRAANPVKRKKAKK